VWTGEVIEEVQTEVRNTLPLRKTTLLQVQEALAAVVDGGTGKNARLPDIGVAGKTGTSQVVTLGEKRIKAAELPWQQRDHAWFVAYAPTENPEIAVATLVEHAEGGGGAVAAPVTREVLSAFFRLKEERTPPRYAQN
jgi:penicillin-binding protein 2